MQLMPATAREYAGRIGETFSDANLRDPAWSRRVGMAVFNDYTKQLGGDPWWGLAAYNGGITAMRKLWEAAGKGGVVEALGQMPRETRNHLQRVAERLGVEVGQR
jgi:soluble lytic murein transglycosylase-like protein